MSEVPLYRFIPRFGFSNQGTGSIPEGNYFTVMCSGSEEGLYSRLIDVFITQL